MKRTLVAAALLLLAATAEARPKIGLALGGGGARGAAHIGVLRVLEELHVPVDYVAGTSMGAVVGGLYASGMSPDEIEQALTSIDWNDTLSDRTSYKELIYRRKQDESRHLTSFEAGLRKGRLISQLPTPFKAVAADIETGEAVVLDHGDLAEAIRASMSIPGVFSPMEIDGRLLVDGGIADNVPVDVVRAMGADIVIAVDVGGPMLKREQMGSMFAVTSQVLTIVDPRIVRARVSTRPGQPFDGERLRADVARLYALDDFQSVTFAVREKDGENGVVIDMNEKPWGPTYVRFGVRLADDLQGNSNYSLVANVTRTRLNALGAEWRNDFRIGQNAGFLSELYQPLDFHGRFFVAPSVTVHREKFPFYDGPRRIAMYDVQERSAALDLGMELGHWGELRAGVVRGRANAAVDAGAVDLPEGTIDRGAARASLVISRTDSPTIPREGGMLVVDYYGSRKGLGGEQDYSRLSVDGAHFFSRGRQTVFIGGAGGTSLNSEIPATLIVGADTIAGPIFLGYARAETGDDRFYMTVGKTF